MEPLPIPLVPQQHVSIVAIQHFSIVLVKLITAIALIVLFIPLPIFIAAIHARDHFVSLTSPLVSPAIIYFVMNTSQAIPQPMASFNTALIKCLMEGTNPLPRFNQEKTVYVISFLFCCIVCNDRRLVLSIGLMDRAHYVGFMAEHCFLVKTLLLASKLVQ